MKIKEMVVSQKLGAQTLQQFENEAEKKLMMNNYIVGKLVSDLMRKGYLVIQDKIEEDGTTTIEAKITVAKG